MVNTEQPQTKAAAKSQGIVKAPKADKKALEKVPVKTEKKAEEKKVETPKTENEKTETPEKKPEVKKPAKKVKKEFAVVNARGVKISTKYAVAICRFVKNKRIEDAIKDLEEVSGLRKAVPMRGEYAHKKNVSIASGAGKYPVNAAKEFVVLLKSLMGNANNHEINEPVVFEAMANKAASPMGRFGRWKRKRTHVTLKARELKVKDKKNKEKKK